MRSLKKEKRTVYVSQPLPQQEIKDSDGNDTGVMENVWDEPVQLSINVKPITDELERQAFGTDVKSILKAEFTPFDVGGYEFVENSIAWIGIQPNGTLSDGDPAKPMNYNYTVEQVLDTGSQITVYFKKEAGAIKA
jgi:hypothetical protein